MVPEAEAGWWRGEEEEEEGEGGRATTRVCAVSEKDSGPAPLSRVYEPSSSTVTKPAPPADEGTEVEEGGAMTEPVKEKGLPPSESTGGGSAQSTSIEPRGSPGLSLSSLGSHLPVHATFGCSAVEEEAETERVRGPDQTKSVVRQDGIGERLGAWCGMCE